MSLFCLINIFNSNLAMKSEKLHQYKFIEKKKSTIWTVINQLEKLVFVVIRWSISFPPKKMCPSMFEKILDFCQLYFAMCLPSFFFKKKSCKLFSLIGLHLLFVYLFVLLSKITTRCNMQEREKGPTWDMTFHPMLLPKIIWNSDLIDSIKMVSQ